MMKYGGSKQHHFHADAGTRSTPACIIVLKNQTTISIISEEQQQTTVFCNETLAQVCKGTPSFGIISF